MNNETDTTIDTEQEYAPGFIVEELAKLPEKTILDEKHLASLIRKHPRTVQRMINRGELPPPADFANHKVWLVSSILEHVERALKAAAQKAENEAARIARFTP